MYTFDTINSVTGFANGDKFANEQAVREYFTYDTMAEMFGADECADIEQDELDAMAQTVIQNGWHMIPAPRA